MKSELCARQVDLLTFWGSLAGLAFGCAGPLPKAPAASSAERDDAVRVVSERTLETTLPAEAQQSPDAGAEAALRRHIESVQRGTPNYDDMSAELATAVRAQPGALEAIKALGEVQSIRFKGKGRRGANLFDVTSVNGGTHWQLSLNAEGKVAGLFFQPAPPAVMPSEAELLTQLEAQLDRAAAADTFAGVVLIAKNDQKIFEAARGLADRDQRLANSLQTKFRLGSMNKMFTAVAVLQLRDAGKLQLDDALAKWLPDYPNAELANAGTLHHLLTHTGGTGDIFGPDYGAHREQLVTHRDYVNVYGKRGLEFKPGERFAYSNYGFVLLGRVIEAASGESYYDYVDKHVFAPAGMKATGSALESEKVPGRAVGYQRGPSGLAPNVDFLPPRGMAAGGGYSTAEDMLRFA